MGKSARADYHVIRAAAVDYPSNFFICFMNSAKIMAYDSVHTWA